MQRNYAEWKGLGEHIDFSGREKKNRFSGWTWGRAGGDGNGYIRWQEGREMRFREGMQGEIYF